MGDMQPDEMYHKMLERLDGIRDAVSDNSNSITEIGVEVKYIKQAVKSEQEKTANIAKELVKIGKVTDEKISDHEEKMHQEVKEIRGEINSRNRLMAAVAAVTGFLGMILGLIATKLPAIMKSFQ